METLSSSPLTSFQVPKPSKLNHHPYLKPPVPHHHHHPSAASKTAATSSFSNLQQKDHFTPLNFNYPKNPSSSFLPPLNRSSTPPRASVHRRAASGYAAALLDVCQCNGTVLKVERDVRRVMRVLRNGEVKEFMMDEMVQEIEKGKVVKEMLERGKFEKNLVGLVKLVIDKGNKVELVKEILEEFLMVFSQLSDNIKNVPTQPPRLVMGNF